MSKLQKMRYDFPALQKLIVLYLAQSEPQTINKIKNGIKKDYSNTHDNFVALKDNGLVKAVSSKSYLNRIYPEYWITELGICLALIEGAKPEPLLTKTLQIYPEDKDLHLLIETTPILGKNALDVLCLAVLNRGAINETDLISIFAAQMQNKLTSKQITQFIAVLKKYPEQHHQTRKNLKELFDLL